MSDRNTITHIAQNWPDMDFLMPMVFVGHGDPRNAILENEFVAGWRKIALEIPKPKAIVCISAHWETRGTKVTMAANPHTIHDFYGFPRELHQIQYPAPGEPFLGQLLLDRMKEIDAAPDYEWGLDHGTWCVLSRMYPQANLPVVQISIDYTRPHEYHYELATELAFLRKKGVLVVGSGNIVHNLWMADLNEPTEPFDWAIEFDEKIKTLLSEGNHQAIIHYSKMGKMAELSVPTADHYLPLLYTLALQLPSDHVSFPVEGIAFRSGSMRSVLWMP